MLTFTLPGFIVIAAALGLSTRVVIRNIRGPLTEPDKIRRMLIGGSLLFTASLILGVFLFYDLERTVAYFRPIAVMGSEPVRLLSLVGLIAGDALWMSGIFQWSRRRSTRK